VDHMPDIYNRFSERYPAVMEAYGALGEAVTVAGPLNEREQRLVKLAIAVGSHSRGAVRSHARRAVAEGVPADAVQQVAVLAISGAGYPAAIAAYQWIQDVLSSEAPNPSES
jgi:alkylhydroperoxidase/carboxymuconolactone decarboxylase family protein YurZ